MRRGAALLLAVLLIGCGLAASPTAPAWPNDAAPWTDDRGTPILER